MLTLHHMSLIAISSRSLSASLPYKTAITVRWSSCSRVWVEVWELLGQAWPKVPLRRVKLPRLSLELPSLLNMLTGLRKTLTHLYASLSVSQATHSLLDPSLSSLWSSWATTNLPSSLVALTSQFIRLYSWTIPVTPLFSTVSCRIPLEHSNLTLQSVRFQANHSPSSALSSTQRLHDSTTSMPSSSSTTPPLICNRYSSKASVTPLRSPLSILRSSSQSTTLVSQPSRSSQSRTSPVSQLNTSGECLKSTEMKSNSSLKELFWCQMRHLRSKLSSLLSRKKSIKSVSLSSPRTSLTKSRALLDSLLQALDSLWLRWTKQVN